MASSAALINSECSPISFVEESLEESHVALQNKKQRLKDAQTVRSPFLVGTIDEVNKKVSKLDRKLQKYTALVVESRSTDKTEESNDYTFFMHLQDEAQAEDYEQRLREVQEVNQFAGIYTMKSTLLSKPSERVKNIHKISMSPSKATLGQVDKNKPKFVELHQFPGFSPKNLTPLPNGIVAADILAKVAEAQPKLKKTPLYRPEFERMFYSQMSQAILQDTFWYLFLDKWQKREFYQQQIFNRVAHNYVKMMNYSRDQQYKDTYLKDYPSFLAQGVYSAYCNTFPDSYRQYDDQFKEDLVTLVYQWVAGIKPAPRIWMKWNMQKLEPDNIKLREELIRQAQERKMKGNSSILDFSFLEQSPSYISGSQSTLNQVGSVSSFTSNRGNRRPKNKRSVTYHRSTNLNSKKSDAALQQPHPSPSGGEQQQQAASQAISEVAHATEDGNRELGANDSKVSVKVKKSRSGGLGELKEETSPLGGERKDPLTPIRELEQENSEYDDTHRSKGSVVNYASKSSLSHRTKHPLKESHPACRGPDFVRSTFNTYGQSPLVAQFLKMQNLEPQSGILTRVQRTEIENLPPLNHMTYRDIRTKTYKKVREAEKINVKRCEKEAQQRQKFVMKQKAVHSEYMRKEGALLSQKREVKRLSDLIMLELKKDQDSVSAGAAQALEAALLSQDV